MSDPRRGGGVGGSNPSAMGLGEDRWAATFSGRQSPEPKTLELGAWFSISADALADARWMSDLVWFELDRLAPPTRLEQLRGWRWVTGRSGTRYRQNLTWRRRITRLQQLPDNIRRAVRRRMHDRLFPECRGEL